MVSLVTLGSPHQGIFGIPECSGPVLSQII